ncbi:MAG: cytochrome c3 family protein [Phycisphaeraceae bacterium]|nr:cytochrome c3 family protein [Phycisphaeraceae bacterium]
MLLAGVGMVSYVPLLLGLTFSPRTTDIGYAPKQPVEFSHAVHAGQLGMDCRYCHTTVEEAAFAAVPPTATCANCHSNEPNVPGIWRNQQKLTPVHESLATGRPIEWVRVHDLPDYAYFNHAAHVNKGVGCVECHGRVDEMEVVTQVQTLSMAWCLECHREPERFLRPVDQVTNMTWDPVRETGKSQLELGLELKKKYDIKGPQYMTSCSTCHR